MHCLNLRRPIHRAEAFSSIGWAATAALALAVPIGALVTGLITAAILAAAWKISPQRE